MTYGLWKDYNHNVRLSLLLTLLSGIADSIWTGTVLAAVLYGLGNMKSDSGDLVVGIVAGVMGVSQLVTALPIGWVADKWSRAKIIASGGCVMYFATAGTIAVTWFATEGNSTASNHSQNRIMGAGWMESEWGGWRQGGIGTNLTTKFTDVTNELAALTGAEPWEVYAFIGCMGVWGLTSGIVNGPGQALFANSVPTGSRTSAYTKLFTVNLLASATGPLLTVIMFKTLGDGWSLPELRAVMITGLTLEAGVATCMLFFVEERTLVSKEEVAELTEGTSGPSGSPVTTRFGIRLHHVRQPALLHAASS